MMIEQHFVVFYRPGLFYAVASSRRIDRWDVDKVLDIVGTIIEVHGYIPFGFQFITRRNDGQLDSRETARSQMYYLGGTILTINEVKARNDPSDRVLIDNMRHNKFGRVIENYNSRKVVLPLDEEDVVLDYTPPKRSSDTRMRLVS
jgi:hypothetical protein